MFSCIACGSSYVLRYRTCRSLRGLQCRDRIFSGCLPILIRDGQTYRHARLPLHYFSRSDSVTSPLQQSQLQFSQPATTMGSRLELLPKELQLQIVSHMTHCPWIRKADLLSLSDLEDAARSRRTEPLSRLLVRRELQDSPPLPAHTLLKCCAAQAYARRFSHTPPRKAHDATDHARLWPICDRPETRDEAWTSAGPRAVCVAGRKSLGRNVGNLLLDQEPESAFVRSRGGPLS